MIKNNYHTHVAYCNHAVGNVEDYVKKAIEYGFNEIGITDHAPILESFMTKEEYIDNWCQQNMKEDTVPIYLNDIEEARKTFGNQIHILSGFESEYIEQYYDFYKNLKDKVDYLNLGIHYFKMGDKIYNSYAEVDYISLEGYVRAAILGMESGLFNTLVHPDLFMYAYKNVDGKREFDSYCALATKRICESAIKNNVYLEVNANGLKNSMVYANKKEWLYPCEEFWKIAREYKDLKVIIGADAHSPDALANQNVETICKFCNDLELNICDKMEINH